MIRARLYLMSLLMAGCQGFSEGPYPIEGSTWVMDEPKMATEGDVSIDVFANRKECRNDGRGEVAPSEVEDCIPAVDRGTGQVNVSFRILDKKGDAQYLTLTQDMVDLAHFGSSRQPTTWDLIPHGSEDAPQLFIIIIDGSSSIYDTGGITKIHNALTKKGVIDSFLPARTEGRSNGVILLRFSKDLMTIDGKDPLKDVTILERPKEYKKYVDEYVENRSAAGYSFMYDAVVKASTKLIDSEKVRSWLQNNGASPTIVLLADGFNNEAAPDVCATNVPRLTEALATVEDARRKGGTNRLTVHTVGLGTALQPGWAMPLSLDVNEASLCRDYGDQVINGHLELIGIDNPSLEMLAYAGGGKSWVKKDSKGLEDVFLETAARRYKWYTLKSELDSFYHRQSFDARIRLKGGIQAQTTLEFHPSAWMDAPSGTVPEDERWFVKNPFRRSLSPVMLIVGFLTILGFVGPATFNARRALFRRPRGK